jgi:hypothetical protein
MMFNTDFEIFFDLDLDQNGKAVCKLDPTCVEAGTCGKKDICAKADTYEQGQDYIKVKSFKNSQKRWTKIMDKHGGGK